MMPADFRHLILVPHDVLTDSDRREIGLHRIKDDDDVTPMLKALVVEDPYFTARGGRNRSPQPWQRHDPVPAAGATRQHNYVRPSIRRTAS